MADVNQYMLGQSELAEVILKHLNVHEGKWYVSLTIHTSTGNFSVGAEQPPAPGAAFMATQFGINRVLEGTAMPPNAVIVDAAEVNPIAKRKVARRKN